METIEKIDNSQKDAYGTKARKARYIEALQKSLGVKTTARKAVGIGSPNTIDEWIKKDPKFAKAVAECEEYAGDFAESALFKKIKEGDTTAIIFFLKTKMKKRGYTERTEITGSDGKDLFASMTDEELNKQIADLQRKLD